jgi:thymidylate synthase
MRNEQLKREPFDSPRLVINSEIKTIEDIESWVTLDDFSVEGYQCHAAINYPFAV